MSDKVKAVQRLAINNSFNLKNILYVCNDLNDYHVMKFCGLSACPSDSHTKIKELSDIMLKTKGGEGVVRELLENIFNINFIKILQEN